MYRRDVKHSQLAEVPSSLAIVELEEEEQDAAVAPHPLDSALSCVSVEWMVVFSKTYRIPQLCFNVYDGSKSQYLSHGVALTFS